MADQGDNQAEQDRPRRPAGPGSRAAPPIDRSRAGRQADDGSGRHPPTPPNPALDDDHEDDQRHSGRVAVAASIRYVRTSRAIASTARAMSSRAIRAERTGPGERRPAGGLEGRPDTRDRQPQHPTDRTAGQRYAEGHQRERHAEQVQAVVQHEAGIGRPASTASADARNLRRRTGPPPHSIPRPRCHVGHR